MNPEVVVRDTAHDIGRHAAECFVSEAEKAIAKTGRFTVAFSGGSTPRHLFEALATLYLHTVSWDAIQFFWTDERCVPPDDPSSNFRLAHDTLLAKVPVRDINIHRIRGELTPEAAAAAYRDEIRVVFGPVSNPTFDLIFLGIGEDGHTASLFPGNTDGASEVEVIEWVYVDELRGYRVTMTLPLLNNAKKVIFMAAGKAKKKAISNVLQGLDATIPAAQVKPRSGKLLWLLDREAASGLPEQV